VAKPTLAAYACDMPKRVSIIRRDDVFVLVGPHDELLASAESYRELSNYAFANGADYVSHYYDPTVLPGWYTK
jgi:hypothetical protein